MVNLYPNTDMTMEQFSIIGLLAKDGLKTDDVVSVPPHLFLEHLSAFTWSIENIPLKIAPNLIAYYDGMNYGFDLYEFCGYKLNVFFGQGGSPTLFVIWGEGGALIILRGRQDEHR